MLTGGMWKEECRHCLCPRLAGQDQYNSDVKDDIKELKNSQKESAKKLDGIYKILIAVLVGLVTASIMLAINIVIGVVK